MALTCSPSPLPSAQNPGDLNGEVAGLSRVRRRGNATLRMSIQVPYRDPGPETGLLLQPLFLAWTPRAGPLPHRDPTALPPDSHPTQATIQEKGHLLTGTLESHILLGRAFRPAAGNTKDEKRAH